MNRVSLDSVCIVIAGQSPPSSTYNQDGDGVPFFQGKADFGETYPSVRYWCNEPRKMSEPNDILFSLRAPVGPTNINNINACIGRGLAAIRCNDIELKYLLHYLRANEERIASLGTGSTFKAITIGALKELQIPLPPLDQQKKIAAILDSADAYRQKTKALLTKYDELTQSLFLDMFGNLEGEKVPLSEICAINPRKSEISTIDKDTAVSFVPMANVSEDGEVNLELQKPLSEVWSGFTYFKENDVVFAKITPCMENGKGAIMRGLNNRIGFGTTEFHVLRPIDEKSTPEYLFYLTHSRHFRENAEINMTGSAGQKRVPTDFFSKYVIVPPSLDLQYKFGELARSIGDQISKTKTSLQKADDLFSSLLQRAFKGKLI